MLTGLTACVPVLRQRSEPQRTGGERVRSSTRSSTRVADPKADQNALHEHPGKAKAHHQGKLGAAPLSGGAERGHRRRNPVRCPVAAVAAAGATPRFDQNSVFLHHLASLAASLLFLPP